MKVTKPEIKVLIEKYRQEGLKDKEIQKRIFELIGFNEFLKIKERYLKC